MASNFQSSFIPKEPITEEVFKPKKAGIVGVLAVSLFVTTIIVSGALFAYKSILKNEIEDVKSQLAAAEKSIDKKSIKEMSQFSKKLNTAKSLVAKHQAMSGFLSELASSTVSSVQFTDFNYEISPKGELQATMNGKTSGYASVAVQEEVFSKNKNFRSVSISDLQLGSDGSISFKVSLAVDPKILAYAE